MKVQIETNGTELVGTLWTKLPDGLGEIRWKGRNKHYRIYCSEEHPNTIAMHHFVDGKKWWPFSNEDEKITKRRRDEFRSKSYRQDERFREYLRKNQRNV